MTPSTGKLVPTEKAVAILTQLNITKPPVPVEKIAKHLGAQVRFSPLDDEISGMIHVRDRKPIIGINSLHHPNRQRFTIAHELGHLVLHRSLVTSHVHVDKDFPVLMRDSKASSGSDKIEIEANQFAAELLMPRSLLKEMLADKTFDVDDEKLIETLAQRFKVSKQAMGHRISAVLQFLA
jgi:Zn-dependent peptidase ImmA (M78 family)